MKDSEADIAIGVLNKLIDQELEAVRAATRDGNTPFVGYAQTRHNAFLYARDEIRKALAAAVDERGAGNPFLPQRDELVTQDMHTCDLCGPVVFKSRLFHRPHLWRPGEDIHRGVRRLHVAVEVQPGPDHLAGCLPSFRAVAPVPIGGRRMKDRTPHLCRNALGTAICASNGIGPSQDADRRIEHCVICGRWWKIYAVSPYLTIWTEPPGWAVWLLRHKTRKTMHNQQRKESK